MESFLPLLSPIIGVIGAIILALLSIKYKHKRLADLILISFNAAILGISITIFCLILKYNDYIVYGAGGWLPPLGIVYIVGKLSSILGLITSIIIMLISIYCLGFFGGEERRAYQLYILFLLLHAALLGIYYTGDIFNLFVMIELMAVASYAMVAYNKKKGEAVEASLKYGMIACLAGIILFIGIGFIYAYLGSLSMPDLAAKIAGIYTPMSKISGSPIILPDALLLIIGIIIWSFMIESAVFPVHFWLPDAHAEAPAPVSAALSGLVVNAGLYCIIRILFTIMSLGGEPISSVHVLTTILLVLGCIGSIYASARMLVEKDIKRLIAFSTILHMCLIIIGISLGTRIALTASIYHFVTHSFSKALAFLSVGVLVASAGTRNIEELSGYAKIHPGAAAGAIIAMLGLAGIPPLGTFPSKLLLIISAIQSGVYWAGAAMIIASTTAAIGYFRIIHILINKPPIHVGKFRMTISIRTSMAILIIGVILVGLMLPIMAGYSLSAANMVMNIKKYICSVNSILARFGID